MSVWFEEKIQTTFWGIFPTFLESEYLVTDFILCVLKSEFMSANNIWLSWLDCLYYQINYKKT